MDPKNKVNGTRSMYEILAGAIVARIVAGIGKLNKLTFLLWKVRKGSTMFWSIDQLVVT